MNTVIDESDGCEVVNALRKAGAGFTKMPRYDDNFEPDDVQKTMIEQALERNQWDILPVILRRWYVLRFTASMMRFGCYPPPNEWPKPSVCIG